jgi:hypothetical protein
MEVEGKISRVIEILRNTHLSYAQRVRMTLEFLEPSFTPTKPLAYVTHMSPSVADAAAVLRAHLQPPEGTPAPLVLVLSASCDPATVLPFLRDPKRHYVVLLLQDWMESRGLRDAPAFPPEYQVTTMMLPSSCTSHTLTAEIDKVLTHLMMQ